MPTIIVVIIKLAWHFTLVHNVSGLWARAVCGRIRCRTATMRMRAQNPQSARQPACEHRRVLWPVV